MNVSLIFIFECMNNLKRQFDLLGAIIGESSFIFMLSFTLKRCYKQLKHDKSYLIMSIHQVTDRKCALPQIKTMVALVYDKITTTYTSILMYNTFCRTKWRLATCAYQFPEMLDADWSVELSITYMVLGQLDMTIKTDILYRPLFGIPMCVISCILLYFQYLVECQKFNSIQFILFCTGDGPFPGLTDMYGGLVSLVETRAALLASHGYAVLALKYLYGEGLPKLMLEVDFPYIVASILRPPYIMWTTSLIQPLLMDS